LAGALPGQLLGHPLIPLALHAPIADCPGGALRTPSRCEQPLPGFEPLTLPPVDTTGPGVGVAVWAGAAAGAGVAGGGRGV
jgi:hypothetical protein